MNRYPLWKYLIIVVALAFGVIYTIPNFFGSSPAVQIASVKATVHADTTVLGQVEQALARAGIAQQGISLDAEGSNPAIRVRFADTDTQARGRELLDQTLNPDRSDPAYVIADNLLPRTPQWLQSLHALPMYLGLDLRGGVHFLMQVDLDEAINKRMQSIESDLRTTLRDKDVRHAGIQRSGDRVEIRFRDTATRSQAMGVIHDAMADLALKEGGTEADPLILATLTPTARITVQDNALKQNITTLKNRIN
jgi:preprotein translocase subunit SecD